MKRAPLLLTVALAGLCTMTPVAQAGGPMLSVFDEDVPSAREQGIPFRQFASRFTPDTTAHARKRESLIDLEAHLANHPPSSLRNQSDLACTAVAVYFESRGESFEGQKAVASVVLQRAQTPHRWGSRPCDVVKPVQFSFMTSKYGYPSIRHSEADWEVPWASALKAAREVLLDGPLPELHGADHYHATYVHPAWRRKMPRVARIGKHIFYADPESR